MTYWIVMDHRKMGPFTLDETRRLPIGADTFVWHKGLSTWVRASEVSELADLFASPAPIVPPPPAPPVVPAPAVKHEVADQAEAAVEDAEAEAEAAEAEEVAEADVAATDGGYVAPPPPPAPPRIYEPERSGAVRPPKPPTYLAWSIASIVLCCLIPGVIAVIYAAKVTPCYDRGDYEAARKASERAELWLIIAITLGIVAAPFQFVLTLMQ